VSIVEEKQRHRLEPWRRRIVEESGRCPKAQRLETTILWRFEVLYYLAPSGVGQILEEARKLLLASYGWRRFAKALSEARSLRIRASFLARDQRLSWFSRLSPDRAC
jgi:hypothetical protein